ncbi:asparaginase [Cellulomonas sp. NPDC089187]|uniref:asparaginase n=1 Tax=Cellulomonas sp. NPDC089187 TaxID=3154970 RepID=UPI00343D1134
MPGIRPGGPQFAERLHAAAAVIGSEDVATRAVPLARVVRGDLVESVHSGHLVVLDPDGQVLLALGDPRVTLLARSSLKPLQTVGMLRAGLSSVHPTGEQLALACASHNGEDEHLRIVRGMLDAAGLTEDDLANTPDMPLDPDAAFAWRTAGHGAASITQNCSGKHAAMLMTTAAHDDEFGWDTDSYWEPEHPLQVALIAAVEELTGVPVEHTTIDGCGAPLFSTSLTGLAKAFGRIARAGAAFSAQSGVDVAALPEAQVALAMSEHPELVGGTGRDVTRAMQAVPGLVAKDGADGVYAAGLPNGASLAFKIVDGGARPRPAVLAAALRVAGALDLPGVDIAELDALGTVPVLGHGEPVGAVVPAF